MKRKSSLEMGWYYICFTVEGSWLAQQDGKVFFQTDDKDHILDFLYSANEELLQDKIICLMRKFSENGYSDFTTGFQRYEAKDIIDLVREKDSLDKKGYHE